MSAALSNHDWSTIYARFSFHNTLPLLTWALPLAQHQRSTSNPSLDTGSGLNIIYEQPQPIELPLVKVEHSIEPARPSTSYSGLSGWINSSRLSLSVSRPLASKPKIRPIISAPRDFRRVEEPPQPQRQPQRQPSFRKHKFRPLNLSIHQPAGQLSPLPDFDIWSLDAGLKFPEQARVRTRPESTCERGPLNIDTQMKPQGKRASALTIDTLAILSQFDKGTPPIPPRSPDRPTAPHILSVPRPASFRSASPANTVSSREPSLYLQRQMSFRRDRKLEVDEEIRELNIIVEETRRAEAASASRSRSMTPEGVAEHRPAIAPTMVVRARTETLSDIGSAFSTPLSHGRAPPTPDYSPSLASGKISDTYSLQHPNMSTFRFPVPSNGPIIAPSRSTARTRVTDWLRSKSGKSTPASTSPFYQCQPLDRHMQHSSFASETTVSTVQSFSFSDESPLSNASSPPTVATYSPAMSPLPLTKSRSMQSLSSMRWNNYNRARGLSTSSSRTSAPLPTRLVKEEEADNEYRRSYAVGVAF